MSEVKRREEQISEIVFATPRERIQEERSKSDAEDFAEDYVKFLSLADEEILHRILEENRYFYYIMYCQICGQGFAIDECYALLKYSFCGEGPCHLSIHLSCSNLASGNEGDTA